MEQEIRFNERNLLNDRFRLSDEFEKSMNTAFSEFIVSLIAIRGAGKYEIAIALDRSPHSDYRVYRLSALDQDGFRIKFPPSPDWEAMPENINWWTVSATGQVVWHEKEPIFSMDKGFWHSGERMRIETDRPRLEIPIGIDWRTLKLERPAHAIARHKLTSEPPPQQVEASGWGILKNLRRLLP